MRWSGLVLAQSRAVLVVTFLLCAAGVWAASRLPVAIFPATDFPRIVIVVDNGVVPGAKQLVTVTQPIEQAMGGIPGVVRITSNTARGATEINLFFDWGVDIVRSLQLVQGRISQLVRELPAEAQIVDVERLTFAVFPVAGYSLTSPKRSTMELRDLAEVTLRPRLSRLEGVAGVDVAGGEEREIHVVVRPDALMARDVGVDEVVDALGATNVLASPGLLEENHQLELTVVSGEARDAADLGRVVVGTPGGVPVTVADVARVESGATPAYTIVTADGHPAVLLAVRRQPDANTISVVAEVEDELARARSLLPTDVVVAPFYDQSLLVRASMRSVRDSILLGLVLSVGILFAFLRSWGTTLVAILVVPVTLLITFFVMSLAGLSFDLMTLGGVAASIGLVIDTAIVVVENVWFHLAQATDRRAAVEEALNEIAVAIIGSTATPVVVFLPLALLTGVTGIFFRSLALTMAVALLASLVVALTFTPVLAVGLLGRKGGAEHVVDADIHGGPLLSWLTRTYAAALGTALRWPRTVLAVSAATAVASVGLVQMLGSDFLPEFDEGAFVLDYEARPGTSLAETDRLLRHVETLLANTEEVESWSRRTGLQLGLSITEPNTGDFLVKLRADRRRGVDEITEELRAHIEGTEPALRVEFVPILGDLVGDLVDSPSPVEIKLFSDDADTLEATAHKVEDVISDVPGVVDTFSGVVVSGPALTFRVDPLRAARFGATADQVAAAAQIALDGEVATTFVREGRLIPVRVRMPPEVRTSVDALEAIPIRAPSGNGWFRLGQVADVEYQEGVTEVHRDGLRRTVAVTARLEGTDLGSGIAAIRKALAEKLTFPAGMTVEYGGLYREEQRSFRELLVSLVLAVVLVFLVLLVEFRSFSHPIAIVAGAVLSLSGVILALLLTGTTLNIVSFVGMIMVVGIVAKNGILLLDAVEDHRARGLGLRDALVHSGRRRFRPVLMTSLATILGMAPLAFAIGSGSELLQPLAIGVIGGSAMALVLSLVVTPVVYALLQRPAAGS